MGPAHLWYGAAAAAQAISFITVIVLLISCDYNFTEPIYCPNQVERTRIKGQSILDLCIVQTNNIYAPDWPN
jgi:hypothetical protein